MSDEHDLRAHFAQQRHCDREHAPAWRPELLNCAVRHRRSPMHWIPAALATSCVVIAALYYTAAPQAESKLSELPPLFDSPPGELFASLPPSFTTFEAPSDFLLSTQHIP
jgi:hypothetical protein